MKDCTFCKIIGGEIPSYKIYEDEFVYAFLDISNDIFGHTLVIPKTHYENVLDCDKETLNHVMNAVKTIANHYIEKCGFDGVNILNSSGKAAEQTVFHLHFHILPRKDGDNYQAFPVLGKCETSLKNVCKVLRLK